LLIAFDQYRNTRDLPTRVVDAGFTTLEIRDDYLGGVYLAIFLSAVAALRIAKNDAIKVVIH